MRESVRLRGVWKPKPRPRGQERQILRYERKGIDAGETGVWEPPWRLSGAPNGAEVGV